MSTPTIEHLHEKIARICLLIQQIQPSVEELKCFPASGQAWHDTLTGKLFAQTKADSPLILAVAGGTNIGKSTIFNHLAQDDASGVSPMASGTKYPVCLVPSQWANQEKLAQLFQGDGSDGFEVVPWTDSQQPLWEHDRDVLFWREGRNLPPQLVLLDTPDIDSSNQGNWRRAEKVRQMSDLIIAVLTQQKYNDLACSQFFAQAAQSGKRFLVVFNQVDLQEHAEYWPIWLKTFVDQVGQDPLLTYVCPHDRTLSKDLQLPFYELDPNQNYQIVPLEQGAEQEAAVHTDQFGNVFTLGGDQKINVGLQNFQTALASLHFDLLKFESLRMALESAMNPKSGLERWLAELEKQSGRYAQRWERFTSRNLGDYQPVPLPSAIVLREFRRWRDSKQPNWIKNVRDIYGKTATVISDWTLKGWQMIRHTPPSPEEPLEEHFLQKEHEQIVSMVNEIFMRLQQESKTDDLTGDQLNRILGGRNREAVLERVHAEHKQMAAVSEDFQQFIENQLELMAANHPTLNNAWRTFDTLLGASRPAVSVVLAGAAFLYVGLVLVPVVVGMDLVVGQAVSDLSTKELVEIFFKDVQTEYCRQRFDWLTKLIQQELLKEYLDHLQACAQFKNSPEFSELRELCRELYSLRLNGFDTATGN